jgi:hypothetical protein
MKDGIGLNTSQFNKVMGEFDTNRSGKVTGNEIAARHDANEDGKIDSGERNNMIANLTAITGDKNLATKIGMKANFGVGDLQLIKEREVVDLRNTAISVSPLPTENKFNQLGQQIQSKNTMNIANTPADPPSIYTPSAPGETVNINLRPGVTLLDVSDDGNWEPPLVKYKDPADGKEKMGTLVRYSTGDQTIIPMGQEVKVDVIPGREANPNETGYYKLESDGSSNKGYTESRYSAIFCTRQAA